MQTNRIKQTGRNRQAGRNRLSGDTKRSADGEKNTATVSEEGIDQTIRLCTVTPKTLPLFENLIDEQFRGLIGWDPDIFCLGAVCRGQAAGVLLFRIVGISAMIQWITVSDAFRRRGIATQLVTELCRRAFRTNTAVVADFFADIDLDRNDLYRFFSSLPFFSVQNTDEGIMQVSRHELETSYLGKIANDVQPECKRFCDLNDTEKKRMLRMIGVSGDVAGSSGELEQDLSLFMENDKVPVAAAFARFIDEDEISLNYLWSDKGQQLPLLALLGRIYHCVIENKPQIQRVRMATVTDASKKLADRLFPVHTTISTRVIAAFDMDTPPGETGKQSPVAMQAIA